MEKKMNTIEIQVEAIANSLNVNPASAVTAGQKMIDEIDVEANSEVFYKAAGCIVEPMFDDEEAQEDYFAFMENDPENWVGFIKNNFGSEWGTIAQIVVEYGY
jgi:hypothetical protein